MKEIAKTVFEDLIRRKLSDVMVDFPAKALMTDGKVYAIISYNNDTLTVDYRRREDVED